MFLYNRMQLTSFYSVQSSRLIFIRKSNFRGGSLLINKIAAIKPEVLLVAWNANIILPCIFWNYFTQIIWISMIWGDLDRMERFNFHKGFANCQQSSGGGAHSGIFPKTKLSALNASKSSSLQVNGRPPEPPAVGVATAGCVGVNPNPELGAACIELCAAEAPSIGWAGTLLPNSPTLAVPTGAVPSNPTPWVFFAPNVPPGWVDESQLPNSPTLGAPAGAAPSNPTPWVVLDPNLPPGWVDAALLPKRLPDWVLWPKVLELPGLAAVPNRPVGLVDAAPPNTLVWPPGAIEPNTLFAWLVVLPNTPCDWPVVTATPNRPDWGPGPDRLWVVPPNTDGWPPAPDATEFEDIDWISADLISWCCKYIRKWKRSSLFVQSKRCSNAWIWISQWPNARQISKMAVAGQILPQVLSWTISFSWHKIYTMADCINFLLRTLLLVLRILQVLCYFLETQQVIQTRKSTGKALSFSTNCFINTHKKRFHVRNS